jgi:hypothetical protein
MPMPGFPLYLGYDLGQVFSSVKFLQQVPVGEGVMWIIFDEVDKFFTRILYKNLAMEIIERFKFWNQKVGFAFKAVHVSDESATTQWRPGSGSYDSMEFERAYNQSLSLVPGLEPESAKRIKLVGCPKGSGSIAARVLLIQNKLSDNSLFVSATCPHTVDMLNSLEADKDNPENPKRTHPNIESFDAASYPMWFANMRPTRNLTIGQSHAKVITCGR